MAQVCFINIFVCLDIKLLTGRFKYLKRYTIPQKMQLIFHFFEDFENNTGLKNLVLQPHMVAMTAPYGCNDQIKGVGTRSSPSCKGNNVLGIFNKQQ